MVVMSQGYGDAGRLAAGQDDRASGLVFLQVQVLAVKCGLQFLQHECPDRRRLIGIGRRTNRLKSPTGICKMRVVADNGHDDTVPKKGTGVKHCLAAGDPAPVISIGGSRKSGKGRRQQFTDSDPQWRKNKFGGISLLEFVGGFLDGPA